MRQAQFNIAISTVPTHYAVFRVKTVPKYLQKDLEVGEIVWWSNLRSCMFRVKNNMSVVLTCEHFEFVSYQTVNEMEES